MSEKMGRGCNFYHFPQNCYKKHYCQRIQAYSIEGKYSDFVNIKRGTSKYITAYTKDWCGFKS